MGSLLSMKFREAMSKSKDKRMSSEDTGGVSYSTGFPNIDFLNGSIVHVDDGVNPPFSYYSIGIRDGSYSMVIGRSHSGKTTFAIQVGWNIIKNFPDSTLFYDDMENGASIYRMSSLLNIPHEQLIDKVVIRNTGITAENVYERIKAIHDIKMENYDKLLYNTGYFDEGGKSIFKLQPSVYVLDSLALLMPDKYVEEDELSGSMSATAAAKTNSAIFKRIIQMLKSANIILICINHINEAVEINPMMRKRSKLAYLKQGETLPGGNAVIYLADTVFRIDDMSKLKEDDTFGFTGSLTDITLCKSRSNRSGQSTTMVFNQLTGFDAELSLFVMLKNAKLVNGAGAYLYFGNNKDEKFSQKQFKEKLASSQEFRTHFYMIAIDYLKGLADKYDQIKQGNLDSYDMANEINSLINNSNALINNSKI